MALIKNSKVIINGTIEYGQDFDFLKGSFPQDLIFIIKEVFGEGESTSYTLIADGYGMLGTKDGTGYGNGAICVRKPYTNNLIEVQKIGIQKSVCPRCEKELRRSVSVNLDLPTNIIRITKQNLRKKDVKIVNSYWQAHLTYCPACGWNPDIVIN